ncbi:queuine tRNA-ribosyltransferase [Leptomonas seymouri]|uniref:Queuine tRNA-ribosyltransferase n=1 Tax=Leptomonas seymouri TaxID=5684 RepID=A0A0N1IKE4_LEPSE|nr:queuine tRNA-ribosyltransferase [Leptomonas seymouri]|eukprot:KPI86155.1 queuine tRNA-ribosyltransferase [Leptomonas seymouri]
MPPPVFTFEENRGPEGKQPVAARSGVFYLPHGPLRTPIFMPVATQGALKGITVDQLEELDVEIILGNTYHLGLRPGEAVLRELTSRKNAREAATGTQISHDGVHNNMDGIHFMESWRRNILTDSGGFQMVSLLKLAQITEEGVRFQSTHGSGSAGAVVAKAEGATTASSAGKAEEAATVHDEGSYTLLLRPEDSIRIQNAIGGDIMMQLDDVVHTLTVGPRVEEAAKRSIRWLDRCLAANANSERQCIFAIVQGALNADLRRYCLKEVVQRTACKGYAIGGLSGGEAKDDFWRMVRLCTKEGLPSNKPRYCMGVGYPEDILVCIALGVDMFDCVYACRTARFGTALTSSGKLQLSRREHAKDFGPLDSNCHCMTCRTYTRSYLSMIAAKEGIAATLLSYHNIAYLINLTRGARRAIEEGRFSAYVQDFFLAYYPQKDYPNWVVEALASVDITLL